MWTEIGQGLLALPENVRNAASGAVGWLTGIPFWGWVLGGAAVLGVGGYAAFRVLHAAAPAVGKVAAERWIPPGPGSFSTALQNRLAR